MRDGGTRAVRIAQVGHEAGTAAALQFDVVDGRGDARGVVVDGHDPRSGAGKSLDQGPADTARARDQNRSVLETKPSTGGGSGRDRSPHRPTFIL